MRASPHSGDQAYLVKLADIALRERELDPTYSLEACEQVSQLLKPASDPCLVDLRSLPWCSIDNGEGEVVTSKDLDQLTVATIENGEPVVRVAISDVDALVPRDSPVDRQAQRNTTTIYCAGKTFPMLDPRLSEDLTSLNLGQVRLAVVTEMTFDDHGKVAHSRIYRAQVRSQACLNYESTGAWLQGERQPPLAIARLEEVQDSLRLQDKLAQGFKAYRRQRGSLTLESLEARPLIEGGLVSQMVGQLINRATELIENLMVACNGCVSRYLTQQAFPTFQRVVRRPKFWPRIVVMAQRHGWELPDEPDSKALQQFLEQQRASSPLHFPDLSLETLKLLGRGEYVAQLPGQPPVGHFGLAVIEYSHSTAPNRRYPDLITQRLLKAAIVQDPCPYEADELEELARHCSEQEANVQKVERRLAKSAAASMLSGRLGQTFEAVVSGQNQRATWVRLLEMPVEGMLSSHAHLGSRLRVRLDSVDIEHGFIDFSVASGSRKNARR